MTRTVQVFPLSTRVDIWGGPVRNAVSDEPGAGRNSLKNSGCRHVLVLVHGFNNTTDAALQSYGVFYARLEEHFRTSRVTPDAVAFFHWPGNYAKARFDAVAWYHIDVDRARESALRLAEYFRSFRDPASLTVTLVGHSLGCRLILHAIKNLGPPPVPAINVVSLMAPAVPVDLVADVRDVLLSNDDLSTVFAPTRRVLKFFSSKDLVLWGAFPLGQRAAYLDGIERRAFGEAVGLYGNPLGIGIPFETTNGHGDYWEDTRTTDELSRALDPTYYTLPTPRRIASRTLASAPPVESRRLSDRA